MNKYWINQGADNPSFWGHEFSKHATCFSTFDVPCYGPEYVEHQEVVEFFETAIQYYRRLPTWGWLSQAGIKPSNTTTYSIGQFQTALASSYGALPYIGCSGPRFNETAAGANSTDNGRTQISEVWYYFHVSVMLLEVIMLGWLTRHRHLDVLNAVNGFPQTQQALSPAVQRLPTPSATLSVPTAPLGDSTKSKDKYKSLERKHRQKRSEWLGMILGKDYRER
jgi:hypothetical protein